MATYAIGDIQGCYDELSALLTAVDFGPKDQLWIAGDLVNRGPKSLETLRFLKNLGSQVRCALGNHDLHLLAIHYGAVAPKRHDTIQDILNAPDREELMNWLRQQQLLVCDATLGYVMTHAGIPPCWSVQKAQKRAKEVEQVLRSEQAAEYFQNMYGNLPDLWSSKLAGWDRLRTITNYLTRMRFVTEESRLEFAAKGTLESQPMGFYPWFRLPRKDSEESALKILFGHWAALEGVTGIKGIFALDTGCVWGNHLTALRLEDQQRFSVPAQPGKTDPPPTSHYIATGKL